MRRPRPEQIAHRPHAELSVLVQELLGAVQRLEVENPQLKAAGATEPPPPPPSHNSAQPPAREVKRNRAADRQRKKLGPPCGHARTTRAWGEQPDRIIAAPVAWGAHGQADLRGVEPRSVGRHPLSELPPLTPVVIATRQPEVVGPDCQRVTRGELPAGLEGGRSCGPRLAAPVVYRKHEQQLSYARVRQLCQDLVGVALSEGGARAWGQRAGVAAQPVATAKGAQVAQRASIGSDETSARVAGRTWWQWVLRSVVGVYCLIRARRAGDWGGPGGAGGGVLGQGLSECAPHGTRPAPPGVAGPSVARPPTVAGPAAPVAMGPCSAGTLSGSDSSGEAPHGVTAPGVCPPGDGGGAPPGGVAATAGAGRTGPTVAETVSTAPGALIRLSALSGGPPRQQRLRARPAPRGESSQGHERLSLGMGRTRVCRAGHCH